MKMQAIKFLLFGVWGVAAAQNCPDAKWDMADPDQSGWSRPKLEAVTQIASALPTSALTVVHKGKIVLDHGRTTSSINVHSVRKSIISVLYGIAHDQGRVKLDLTMAALGVDDYQPLSDSEKTATVRQLLEARSCIYHVAALETEGMAAKRPPRGSCVPGAQWYYNNWDFNVLGTIYQQQTGKTVFEALDTELARPLGFEDFSKLLDTQFVRGPSSRHPGYPIRLSTHDLARVGLLMARGGNWCGAQIVSKQWVDDSTHTISATDLGSAVGYGYMWWTSPNSVHFGQRFRGKVFSARGHLGQYLLVVPGEDLVIAHLVDAKRESDRHVNGADFAKIVRAVVAAMPQPDH